MLIWAQEFTCANHKFAPVGGWQAAGGSWPGKLDELIRETHKGAEMGASWPGKTAAGSVPASGARSAARLCRFQPADMNVEREIMIINGRL